MSATTTQLLSSGEFCQLHYDTVPVKSASANVSFYINNSKKAKFWVVTLSSQMSVINNHSQSLVTLESEWESVFLSFTCIWGL